MGRNAVIDTFDLNGGYALYCTKDKQDNFKTYFTDDKQDLYEYKEKYGQTHNNFLSTGTYKTPYYSKKNIKEMKRLYIDIDTNSRLYQLSKEEIKLLATALLDYEEIPEPSIILFSGHGLQIMYNLKNASDIPLWQRYENVIVKKLENILEELSRNTLTELSNLIELSGIHVDSIKDPTRILRVGDTINIKYDEPIMAEILHENGKTYTLKELKEYEVFSDLVTCTPYNALSITEKDLKAMGKRELNDTLKGTNERLKYFLETRIYTRLDDLETLIQVRNKSGVVSGYRNNLIAIYITTLVNLGYKRNEIVSEIARVNQTFKDPLSKPELEQWINSSLGACRNEQDEYKALHRTYYKYTTKRIMDKLNITEEEQECLKIFINRRIRNKRDYVKNGAKYKAKRRKKYAQATESERISKEERNKKIVELSKQGLTQREIALKMNIGLGTVNRILRACEK